MQRAICRRIFAPAQPDFPAASVRDFLSGAYNDHGSNYMSGDFQDEIECLGIEASPSFVREPQGNGVAERFIRTLKENLLWVRTFDTIEELRAALIEFAKHYNETWLVARHGNRTPAQVRADQCRLDRIAATGVNLAA